MLYINLCYYLATEYHGSNFWNLRHNLRYLQQFIAAFNLSWCIKLKLCYPWATSIALQLVSLIFINVALILLPGFCTDRLNTLRWAQIAIKTAAKLNKWTMNFWSPAERISYVTAFSLSAPVLHCQDLQLKLDELLGAELWLTWHSPDHFYFSQTMSSLVFTACIKSDFRSGQKRFTPIPCMLLETNAERKCKRGPLNDSHGSLAVYSLFDVD